MKARCLQHFNLKLLPKTRSDIVGAGGGGAVWLALPSVCFPDLTTSSIFFSWEFTNLPLTENCFYGQTFQETQIWALVAV